MQFKKTSLSALLTLSIVASTPASANEQVLNVYNWWDYITPGAIETFQEQTGIKVNYDVYDSNEILEAKLMSGGSGYDIVVPSANFLERQAQSGVYSELDRNRLKNYKNLDPALMKQVEGHDPGNAYGVPYTWGTLGLAYNVDMIKQRLGDTPLDSYDLLFKPEVAAKLQDCGIALVDSPAEVVSLALNYLGLDPNSETKEDLKQASDLLSQVRGYYKHFNTGNLNADLINGDICLALGYSGDMLQAQQRAIEANSGANLQYTIPKEGTIAWFDMIAIPADAPNKEAAYKFIDFILEPEVGAGISNYVYYAVPNTQMDGLVEPEILNNPAVYPTDEVKAKLFTQQAHTPKFDRLLSRAWSNIKTGR